MPTRVLLADDHTLLRQGLRRILENHSDIHIVAEAGSGLEAVEMARRNQPDVVIMDVAMKDLNGIEATAQIVRQLPRTAVLMLSMYSDERYVLRSVRAGARGYLLKDSVEDDLLNAIRTLERGGAFFSPAVAKTFQEGWERRKGSAEVDDRYELLTERERHVYQMLAEGNSNKEIAGRLGLSLHTVETHRARIMEKLAVHSTAELVLSAVRRGLVT